MVHSCRHPNHYLQCRLRVSLSPSLPCLLPSPLSPTLPSLCSLSLSLSLSLARAIAHTHTHRSVSTPAAPAQARFLGMHPYMVCCGFLKKKISINFFFHAAAFRGAKTRKRCTAPASLPGYRAHGQQRRPAHLKNKNKYVGHWDRAVPGYRGSAGILCI
jgi:hypothetical protein